MDGSRGRLVNINLAKKELTIETENPNCMCNISFSNLKGIFLPKKESQYFDEERKNFLEICHRFLNDSNEGNKSVLVKLLAGDRIKARLEIGKFENEPILLRGDESDRNELIFLPGAQEITMRKDGLRGYLLGKKEEYINKLFTYCSIVFSTILSAVASKSIEVIYPESPILITTKIAFYISLNIAIISFILEVLLLGTKQWAKNIKGIIGNFKK